MIKTAVRTEYGFIRPYTVWKSVRIEMQVIVTHQFSTIIQNSPQSTAPYTKFEIQFNTLASGQLILYAQS